MAQLAHLNVVVAVVSCTRYLDRRLACERTWVPALEGSGIRTVFVVGDPGLDSDGHFDPTTRTLSVPTGDSYQDLPAKSAATFRWFLRHTDVSHLFKCDDDTFVNPRVFPLVEVADDEHFVGSRLTHDGVVYASGGAGYLLDRAAMALVAADERVPEEAFEDVAVGRALANAGVGFTALIPPLPARRTTDRQLLDGMSLPLPETLRSAVTWHLQRLPAAAMSLCWRFLDVEGVPNLNPRHPWFDVIASATCGTEMHQALRHGAGAGTGADHTIEVEGGAPREPLVIRRGTEVLHRSSTSGHGAIAETLRAITRHTWTEAHRRGYLALHGLVARTTAGLVLVVGNRDSLLDAGVEALGTGLASGNGLLFRDGLGTAVPGRLILPGHLSAVLRETQRQSAVPVGRGRVAVELRCSGEDGDHLAIEPTPVTSVIVLDPDLTEPLQFSLFDALAALRNRVEWPRLQDADVQAGRQLVELVSPASVIGLPVSVAGLAAAAGSLIR